MKWLMEKLGFVVLRAQNFFFFLSLLVWCYGVFKLFTGSLMGFFLLMPFCIFLASVSYAEERMRASKKESARQEAEELKVYEAYETLNELQGFAVFKSLLNSTDKDRFERFNHDLLINKNSKIEYAECFVKFQQVIGFHKTFFGGGDAG